MTRMNDLLIATAEALEDGQIPLSHSFLVEHEVTADEALTLCDQLALGARMVAQAFEDARQGGIYARVAGHQIGTALATHKASYD